MAKPIGNLDRKPVSLESRQRMSRAKLSIKQQRFVQEYAHLGNAAEAARKAGYKPKAAKEVGYENLTKPHVKAAVDQEMARIATEITPDRVQRRLDRSATTPRLPGSSDRPCEPRNCSARASACGSIGACNSSGALNGSHVAALLEVRASDSRSRSTSRTMATATRSRTATTSRWVRGG